LKRFAGHHSFSSGIEKVSLELLEGNLVVPVLVQVLKNLLYLLFAAQLQQNRQLMLCDKTRLIFVNVLKGLFQGLFSVKVGFFCHGSDELVKVDFSRVIFVDVLHNFDDLLLLVLGVLCSEKLNQLLDFYQAASVIVDLKKNLRKLVSLLLCYLLEAQETLDHRHKIVFPLRIKNRLHCRALKRLPCFQKAIDLPSV
jgi:hypothetical protein